MPLGMFSDTAFPVCNLTVDPGDSLFLYTDGLTESFNTAGDEYGVQRVQALASRYASVHPEKMLAGCLEELRAFSSAKRSDDLTLLVLRRTN
jgi:sigma-B regulation protein RsbU (phosphoserine phosphatase)